METCGQGTEIFTLEVAERRIKTVEAKFDFYGETEREKELQKEIDELNRQLERNANDIKDMFDIIQELKETIEDMKNDIVYVDDRVDEVEADVSCLEIPDITDLEDRVSELESAIEDCD